MLKASIVIIGVQNSPSVLSISTVPTIGPVQEKLTRTRVKARKKTPPRPFLPEFLSAPLTHLDGSTISKAPKKDAAKIINTRKKMRLGSQCVESQLKMSAVTASPPSSQVRPMIIHIGRV